jgi:hypothetical protein
VCAIFFVHFEIGYDRGLHTRVPDTYAHADDVEPDCENNFTGVSVPDWSPAEVEYPGFMLPFVHLFETIYGL